MRGAVANLPSPLPLADGLPGILREDPFARGLCGAFDEVLAPVLLSLDAFPAYLDVRTAPADLLPWFAQWMAITVDPHDDESRLRPLVGAANRVHEQRGTAAGIRLAVEAALGVPVEVVETGGAAWSATPGGELPGEAAPFLRVVAHQPVGGPVVDADELEALVAAARPAHVPYQTAVVTG